MRKKLFLFILLFLFLFLSAGPPNIPVPEMVAPMDPPPLELSGSDASQRWQNYMADREHLARIETHRHLLLFEGKGLLVPLPNTRTIRVDPRLKHDPEYCYTRPWTRKFLIDCASQLQSDIPGSVFQINSAVRDRVRQKNLRRKNANAAATTGPKESSHLTGATVDITKLGMSHVELLWWRKKLIGLERAQLIEATEESNQAVFHIMVFKRYEPDDMAKPHKMPSKRHKKVDKK